MPRSRAEIDELLRLDRAHVIHPITELKKHEADGAQIFVGGKGIELELADGRRVIDGFSGLFNINVGHGRTEIADAVAAQMRQLAYYPSFWDFGNEPATRLAERLVGLLPADRHLTHMLFNSGGSEANEANFKFARLYHAVGASSTSARSSRAAGPSTARRAPPAAPPASSPTTR
jgi:4-aminobutyrate--pyruvate transaminase